MVIALVMLLLLTAVLFAWLGKRNISISIYIISLILAVGVFIYHTSGDIKISL